MFWSRRRKEQELADAREEALRWYERLGGQIMNLPTRDDLAVKQSMIDASERYTAAGAQLDRATTPKQYTLARETALEGLAYIRAARLAMGLDAGPDLPPLASARSAGSVNEVREMDVQGHHYKASPRPAQDTPYYYPGGTVQGRPVPSGWYSEPWWKTALVAGAGAVGSMLLFDALFSGFGFGDNGFGEGFGEGYDDGFEEGLEFAQDQGWDPGGAEASDFGGGDFGGGDFGGGDF